MAAVVWKEILRSQKISLRKTRGQNFLADPNMGRKIVDILELSPADAVLEIGPGLAALTDELLHRAKYVLAVEIEKAFCAVLQEWFGDPVRFEVVNEDILNIDFPAVFDHLRAQTGPGGSVKVISNLPYYISTPILTRLLERGLRFSKMVLTMQKEVAQRITAAPGGKQYGSLSVFTQFFCKAKLEFKIPGAVFYPPPKVDSAVVSFVPLEQPPVLLLNRGLFFELVRASFSARRKTLRNSLKKFFMKEGMDAVRSETLLENCAIDGRRRAETLSIPEFARMANLLSQRKTLKPRA